MVVPDKMVLLKILGPKRLFFEAKIQTFHGCCAEIRRNSGKTATAGITATSRLGSYYHI